MAGAAVSVPRADARCYGAGASDGNVVSGNAASFPSRVEGGLSHGAGPGVLGETVSWCRFALRVLFIVSKSRHLDIRN